MVIHSPRTAVRGFFHALGACGFTKKDTEDTKSTAF